LASPHDTMQESDISAKFNQILKEISNNIGKIMGTRPYIAIVDYTGCIWQYDAPLEQFIEFIQNFVLSNFHLLKIGDHSLPLGGLNLAFFKISQKAMIIIYTLKGLSGQLLSFKQKMFEWSDRIDALLSDLQPPQVTPVQITSPSATHNDMAAKSPTIAAPKPPTRDKKRGLKTVPILTKKLTGKEKFSLDVAHILELCDGHHTVLEMAEETGFPLLKINDIIRTYQKKGWISLKRIV